MTDAIQIMIAKFPDSLSAEEALRRVEEAKTNQGVEVRDAAVVSRAAGGKLQIHETEDVTGGRGATVGGILGAVLGILAGPAGIIAGAAVGAAVGGATARLVDTGIPHKRLEEIGSTLQTPRAALVILTEAGFVDFLTTLVSGKDVEIEVETLNAAVAEQLERDHDVAVKALKMGDAVADGGMVSPVDTVPETE